MPQHLLLCQVNVSRTNYLSSKIAAALFKGLAKREKKLFKDCLSASKLHSFDFANLNLLYYQDYQSFDLQSLRLVEIKILEATRKICNDENSRALQVVPSCHPGWENMEITANTENMEKMENIDQMTSKHSIYDSKHIICDSKYCICQPADSKHSICSMYGHGWKKIITYALGDQDPGSVQDWRTSSEM